MIAGVRACGRGLRHLNARGYTYVWTNVAWLLLSLPIITAPAAWAGFVKMSYLAYRNPSADIGDFWQGFKENLKRTLPLALANIVLVFITFNNLNAYRDLSGVLGAGLRVIWVGTLIVWLMVQFYAYPFLFIMKTPRLTEALRNGLLMLLKNPGFSLGVLLVTGVIVTLSTVLVAAWLLITGGALVAISNAVVIDRLRAEGYEREPTQDEILSDEEFYRQQK